ncbi:MAG TPA: nucleotidyltransferase family protein [Solirubrobacteraceae bacterium]|nr:nucleotidyltransferase family protein [Solirubrobacteraceae bacterium]
MIATVVLAAGSGSRFGKSAKQLAELDGIPLLEHALRAVEAVPVIDRIVVVLGARAEEIRAGVDFGQAEVVVCEDWADGQAASLRCGIEAVAGADAAVLTLGDMPRITPEVIAAFADLAVEHGSRARARAVYDGLPGHPVVLGREYFAQISALEGDVGAREVLKAIGAYPIECSRLCSPADVDTPEALEELRG